MNNNGSYSNDIYREIIESNNIDKNYEYYWLWFKNLIINFNNTFLIEELHRYSSKLNLLQQSIKINNDQQIMIQIEHLIQQYLYQCVFIFIKTKDNMYLNNLLNTQIKRFNLICLDQKNKIILCPFFESNENNFFIFFHIIIHLDKSEKIYKEIYEIALNKITMDMYSNELLLCSIYDILFREKSYGFIDGLSCSYSFTTYLQNRNVIIKNIYSNDIINNFDLPKKINIVKLLRKYNLIFIP
jgi:hypothetical protein